MSDILFSYIKGRRDRCLYWLLFLSCNKVYNKCILKVLFKEPLLSFGGQNRGQGQNRGHLTTIVYSLFKTGFYRKNMHSKK